MRIVSQGAIAALALLIGLGVGYYQWGLKAGDLGRKIERQGAEYEGRISDLERRIKAAEDRTRQELEARKMLEEELHRIRPQK